MRKYEVCISDRAEQDLRGIFEYISFTLLAPENANSQLTQRLLIIPRITHRRIKSLLKNMITRSFLQLK